MSTSLTLWDVEERYLALMDTEALVSPEQDAEFRAELTTALRDVVAKRDRVAQFLLACQAHEDAIAAEINRLSDLRIAWQRGRERMEKYVVSVFEAIGADDKGRYPALKGNLCTLRVQRNPASVDLTDERKIPNDYKAVVATMPANVWADLASELDPFFLEDVQVVEKVSKKAVKTDLERGLEVPGADLNFGELRLVVK